MADRSHNHTAVLRLPSVVARVGLKRASIYRLTRKSELPRRLKMGLCAVGWRQEGLDSRLSVRQGTQLIKGLHGLVAEFGIYTPKRPASVTGFVEDITLGEVLDLPVVANEVIRNLSAPLIALQGRITCHKGVSQIRRLRIFATVQALPKTQFLFHQLFP